MRKILERLYSLSENDDSEDWDEDAAELTCLELTNSGFDERDGAFAVRVNISKEVTELDRQSSDTSEDDESEWAIASHTSQM